MSLYMSICMCDDFLLKNKVLSAKEVGKLMKENLPSCPFMKTSQNVDLYVYFTNMEITKD